MHYVRTQNPESQYVRNKIQIRYTAWEFLIAVFDLSSTNLVSDVLDYLDYFCFWLGVNINELVLLRKSP